MNQNFALWFLILSIILVSGCVSESEPPLIGSWNNTIDTQNESEPPLIGSWNNTIDTQNNTIFSSNLFKLKNISCDNLSENLKSEVIVLVWNKTNETTCGMPMCQACSVCSCLKDNWISGDFEILKRYVSCIGDVYQLRYKNQSYLCSEVNMSKT